MSKEHTMSDPVEKPKLFEREGKPNKPAEQPKEPKEPADKPELFPRDPENPPAEEPAPEPTPKDPSEWPKIATERLMDADEDGDGVPDRWGDGGPILGDDDDLGDIVAGGPQSRDVFVHISAATDVETDRPVADELGNFEIQDVVGTESQIVPDADAATAPTAGVTLPGQAKVTDVAPEQPVADKLGNFEIQDLHAGSDVVGEAIERGVGGLDQPDGDGYYIITMENVVGEEESGDSPLTGYLD